jgi:hypothetical protein
MAGIEEMDQYWMLKDDWGSAYEITHTQGMDRPYQAVRRGGNGMALEAATPGELRELVRDDHAARAREVAL